MADTSRYGRYYWCAKVTNDLSKRGEIYVMADKVVVSDGALHFLQLPRKEGEVERVNLVIPPQKWTAVFAASLIDGSAVAVEHWAGEIVEEDEDEEDEEEEPERPKTGRAGAEKTRKDAAPKTISRAARHFVFERDGGKCRMCGRSVEDGVKLEIDHIDPVAFGGDSSVDNLQTLCQDCNRGKGAKRPTVAVAKTVAKPA